MPITNIVRDWGTGPSIVRIASTDNLSICSAADYLLGQEENISSINNGPFIFLVGDMVALSASDSNQIFRFDGDDFTSLVLLPSSGGGGVNLPVAIGNFAVFDDLDGVIGDSGYIPTDSTKTKVVMQNGPSVMGGVALYSDTNGTIHNDSELTFTTGTLSVGNSLAGDSGTIRLYSAGMNAGSFSIYCPDFSGNYNVLLTLGSIHANMTFTLPTPALNGASILIDSSTLGQQILDGGLYTVRASGTESGGAITINAQCGQITTSPLTTPAGSSYTIIVTNSYYSGSSTPVLLTYFDGTNSITDVTLSVEHVGPPGSFTMIVTNDSAFSLDGTVGISFFIP